MNDGTTTKGFGSSAAYGVNHGGSAGNAEKDSALEPAAGLAAIKDKVIEAKEKIVEIKDMVIEVKDNAMDRSNSMFASLKRTIVASPFTAVAIAFGLGYVGMRITRPLRWL